MSLLDNLFINSVQKLNLGDNDCKMSSQKWQSIIFHPQHCCSMREFLWWHLQSGEHLAVSVSNKEWTINLTSSSSCKIMPTISLFKFKFARRWHQFVLHLSTRTGTGRWLSFHKAQVLLPTVLACHCGFHIHTQDSWVLVKIWTLACVCVRLRLDLGQGL